MTTGPRTPEELDTLFEDVFLTRDRCALARLFELSSVLGVDDVPGEARGGEQIERLVSAMWTAGRTYFAAPRRVLQARDTALVLADRSVSVMHRGTDGTWRYAIAYLSADTTTKGEE